MPLSRRRGWIIRLAIVCSVGARPSDAQPTPSSALTLRTLFESLRAHPTVSAADSRVRAARGLRSTAGAFGNPTLEFEVQQAPLPGGPTANLQRQTMTSATFPLEHLYQRGPRVARADADVRAASADATMTRQRVALDGVDAFYGVALAKTRAETMRDVVQWLDTLVAYNRARVEEGVTAEADLIRAELERDRMAAEHSIAEAELARVGAALGGLTSGGIVVSVAPLDAPLALPSTIAADVSARPDVRAARERVSAATAGVAGERSLIFRELGATFGTMHVMGTPSMVAAISLPVPSFNTNRGEIQRASAERDVATFELAAQERAARAQLAGATEAARILTDRVNRLRGTDAAGFLTRAEEARRIALGTYREGAIPLFQVIDAMRTWADARVTYYTTLVEQHRSVLSLYVAEGMDLFAVAPSLRLPGDPSR